MGTHRLTRVTFKMAIDIAKQLEGVCHLNKSTGFVEYTAGWNDGRIAKEMGCSKRQIRKIREENFGLLRSYRAKLLDNAPAPPITIADDLAAIRSKLEIIISALSRVLAHQAVMGTSVNNTQETLKQLLGEWTSTKDDILPTTTNGAERG